MRNALAVGLFAGFMVVFLWWLAVYVQGWRRKREHRRQRERFYRMQR